MSWAECEKIREVLRRQPAPVCGFQSQHDAGIHICWRPEGHDGKHRCGGCEEEWV